MATRCLGESASARGQCGLHSFHLTRIAPYGIQCDKVKKKRVVGRGREPVEELRRDREPVREFGESWMRLRSSENQNDVEICGNFGTVGETGRLTLFVSSASGVSYCCPFSLHTTSSAANGPDGDEIMKTKVSLWEFGPWATPRQEYVQVQGQLELGEAHMHAGLFQKYVEINGYASVSPTAGDIVRSLCLRLVSVLGWCCPSAATDGVEDEEKKELLHEERDEMKPKLLLPGPRKESGRLELGEEDTHVGVFEKYVEVGGDFFSVGDVVRSLCLGFVSVLGCCCSSAATDGVEDEEKKELLHEAQRGLVPDVHGTLLDLKHVTLLRMKDHADISDGSTTGDGVTADSADSLATFVQPPEHVTMDSVEAVASASHTVDNAGDDGAGDDEVGAHGGGDGEAGDDDEEETVDDEEEEAGDDDEEETVDDEEEEAGDDDEEETVDDEEEEAGDDDEEETVDDEEEEAGDDDEEETVDDEEEEAGDDDEEETVDDEEEEAGDDDEEETVDDEEDAGDDDEEANAGPVDLGPPGDPIVVGHLSPSDYEDLVHNICPRLP